MIARSSQLAGNLAPDWSASNYRNIVKALIISVDGHIPSSKY
jgi:hypothetical protein